MSSSPPRGQPRVTNHEGSRLPPGDRTFWKAPPSATDVTVPEVPCSLRAGCGEGPGGRGSRTPAVLVVGFRSLLLKGRARLCQRPHWSRWELGVRGHLAWIQALSHPPVSEAPTKPEPPWRIVGRPLADTIARGQIPGCSEGAVITAHRHCVLGKVRPAPPRPCTPCFELATWLPASSSRSPHHWVFQSCSLGGTKVSGHRSPMFSFSQQEHFRPF